MSTTGWPLKAIAAAMLPATVDLPSPGLGEVTTITFGGLSTSMKIRLVRILRKASDAPACRCADSLESTASWARSPFSRCRMLVTGTVPTTGTSNFCSTSSPLRSRRSSVWRTIA